MEGSQRLGGEADVLVLDERHRGTPLRVHAQATEARKTVQTQHAHNITSKYKERKERQVMPCGEMVHGNSTNYGSVREGCTVNIFSINFSCDFTCNYDQHICFKFSCKIGTYLRLYFHDAKNQLLGITE